MPQDQPKQTLPPQHQDHRPGTESEMHPKPEFESNEYKAAGKLKEGSADYRRRQRYRSCGCGLLCQGRRGRIHCVPE